MEEERALYEQGPDAIRPDETVDAYLSRMAKMWHADELIKMNNINLVIATIAGVYPDSYVNKYWDYRNCTFNPDGSGDTLAEFIVREVMDTFDANEKLESNILNVIEALERARDDLHHVITALDRRLDL